MPTGSTLTPSPPGLGTPSEVGQGLGTLFPPRRPASCSATVPIACALSYNKRRVNKASWERSKDPVRNARIVRGKSAPPSRGRPHPPWKAEKIGKGKWVRWESIYLLVSYFARFQNGGK